MDKIEIPVHVCRISKNEFLLSIGDTYREVYDVVDIIKTIIDGISSYTGTKLSFDEKVGVVEYLGYTILYIDDVSIDMSDSNTILDRIRKIVDELNKKVSKVDKLLSDDSSKDIILWYK